MKKRLLALLLCAALCVPNSLTSMAAQQDDAITVETEKSVTEEEVVTEAPPAIEEEPIAEEEPVVEEEPVTETESQALEIMWINSGSVVYRDYNDTENNMHTLLGSYEVKIKQTILDENGQPAWYEFEFVNLDVGEIILSIGGFKYVRVENTSVEEPAEPEKPTDPEEPTQPDEPEIKHGDYDAIMSQMETLTTEYEQVTSYEECEEFYGKMMDAYSYAFINDETVVTSEEMKKIDEEFGALQDALYEDFGYTEVPTAAANYSVSRAAFNLKNSSGNTSNGIYTNKTAAETPNGVGDYLLMLESYVTGEVVDYVKPVDLILVLDQSASMYAPMGLSGGKTHKELYTENPSELTRYALDTGASGVTVHQNLKKAFEDTSKDSAGLTFKDKVSQLGYLVAQSRTGGYAYGNVDHDCNNCPSDEGKLTYDWFIIQYVEDDTEGKPWHFYRVSRTANPSTDWDYSHDNEPKVVKFESLDKIGASHFYFYKSQTGALYDSITAFAAALKESGGDHRLAVTGFAGGNITKRYATFGSGIYVDGEYIRYNTEKYESLLTDSDTIYSSSTITDKQYESALMNIQGNYKGVLDSINAVKTDFYYTYQNVGLDIALNIIENAPDVSTDMPGYGREKIVVLFTDGSPSGPTNEDIVAKAAEVKATDAEIYTICTSTLAEGSREFLTVSSSDYPDTVVENGVIVKNNPIQGAPKYAKTAKNASELQKEFLSIVEDVGGADIELGTETILQDVISESFTLPFVLTNSLEGKTETEAEALVKQYIKVYTADYNGTTFGEKTSFDAEIALEKDETGQYRTVKVKNFDYSANFVSSNARGEQNNFYGKKLIVEIPIDPNPDFLGGDDVVTNGEASGIYVGDQGAIAEFPIPKVDVSLSEIEMNFVSKDIYLSQMAPLPEILNLGYFKQNDKKWGVDAINNAYVDIVYTIIDPEGNQMTYTIPAGESLGLTDHGWDIPDGMTRAPLLKEDTTYTVTCTVTSKNDTSNTTSTKEEETVHVFKPEITFKDSMIKMGDTVDYRDNGDTVVWKHSNEIADINTMGAAPTLEYTYDPIAGAFIEDTSVQVRVTAKGNGLNIPIDQDITEYVTFYRDACSFHRCDHTVKAAVDAAAENRVNFVVHLKDFNLTISKEGAEAIDENQSFIFRVIGDNEFSIDVLVVGNDSVTINDLPAGEYTITEMTEWSWRYEPDKQSQTVSAEDTSTNDEGDEVIGVEFKNTRKKPYWLSGDCWCENWWGGTNGVVKRNENNEVLN